MNKGIKIGALWRHKDRNGVEYLSGSFGDATIVAYPSKYPSGGRRNRPLYLLYVQEPPKKGKET